MPPGETSSFFDARPQSDPPSAWARYARAFTVTLAGLALHQLFIHSIDNPFSLLTPIVAYCAWLGGWGPGVLSLGACVLFTLFMNLDPTGSLAISSHADKIRLFNFLFVNCFVVFLSGLARSARDQAEQLAKEFARAEERYRLVAETVSDFSFSYQFAGTRISDRLAWITPSFTRITGYSAGQVRSPEEWSQLVFPDDLGLAIEAENELRAGRPVTRELRIITHAGEIRWIRLSARPLRNRSGKVTGCVGGGQDTTARRAIEFALRDNENRYRQIVETAAEGIWAVDADLRTTFVNRRMAELLGTDVDRLRESQFADWLVKDDHWQAEHEELIRRVRRPYSAERRFQRANGSVLWCRVNVTPLLDEHSQFRGAVGLYTDITSHREAAQALRESHERFELATGVVDGYIYEWNPETGQTWRSQGFFKLLGYDAGDIDAPASFWQEKLHEEDAPSAVQLARESVRRGESYSLEYRARHRDGTWHWLWDRGSVVSPSAGASSVVAPSGVATSVVASSPAGPNGSGMPRRVLGYVVDITSRKQEERALEASMNRVVTILESITDAFISLDRDWHFTYVNPQAEKLLRRPAAELIGTLLWDYFPEDTTPNFYRKYREAVDFGRPVTFEDFYWPLEAWFEVHAYPSEEGLSIYFQDISRRRANEEELRGSEQRFRELADSLPQIVWIARPDGATEYYNRRWYQFTGFDDVPKTHDDDFWRAIVHPEDLERMTADWEASLHNGGTFTIEYRFRDRSTGGYRWFLGRAVPIRNSGGQIIRWFGTCTDIDEQKRQAANERFLADAGAILASSLDYQTTLDRVASLVVPRFADWCFVALRGPDGELQMTSATHRDPAQAALFWERQRLYGLTEGISGSIPLVARTGKPELITHVDAETKAAAGIWAADGLSVEEAGHHSTLTVPLKVGGNIIGAMCFTFAESRRYYNLEDQSLAMELANRVAMAIENARLYRGLKEADRNKDEFLAMLAHELRNPLAAIAGANRLLDELVPPEQSAITQMPRAILGRQLQHLTRLVDDLLDVSRITRGKIELRRVRVDFRDAIRAAADGARSFVTSRHHTLELTLPDEAVMVWADPARLQQIASNIILNAAKYTDPGGQIWVSLVVETDEHEDAVLHEAVLRVRDNGVGLRPEIVSQIWGLFVQSERTLDRAQGGLGIGLTLVRQLTELHGGTVGAYSAGQGQGSEFTVRLPVLAVSESQPSAAPSPQVPEAPQAPRMVEVKAAPRMIQTTPESEVQPVTQATPALPVAVPLPALPASNERNPESTAAAPGVARVLLVDDNQDAAQTLSTWLSLQGHEVRVAFDGLSGIEVAHKWNPDVILLDIGMPNLDGYEVAQRLRAAEENSGSRTKLIAITGYGQPSDRDRAFAAGFDHHFTKPVDVNEVAALLVRGRLEPSMS